MTATTECCWWFDLVASRIDEERNNLIRLANELDGLDALRTPLEHRIAALAWALDVLTGRA